MPEEKKNSTEEVSQEAELTGALIDAAINAGEEGTTPPDEISLSSAIDFTIPTEDGEGTEKWVYDWPNLSPPQHNRAAKLLFYEHELISSPLPSHHENKATGLYDLELEFYSIVLLKKNEDGSTDRYSVSRRRDQEAAAMSALYRMNTKDMERLVIVKKNFMQRYGIPTIDRVRRYRVLVQSLAAYTVAFQNLSSTVDDTLIKSEGTDTEKPGSGG